MALLELLLPPRCVLCGVLGPSPCPGCAGSLRPAPAGPPPPGVDDLAALLRYDEAARALVTAAKYRNHRGSSDGLVPALAALAGPWAPRAVTWAPTTPERARRRGFDQAEVLARAVARALGCAALGCLRRRPGPHQTGHGAAERWAAPAFAACGPVPAAVVVVDDVCTTGATLAAAAAELRRAGAVTVHALVLARTPAGQARR